MIPTEESVARRRQQLARSARVAVHSVAPSIRSFAQALDRQRRQVERVPVLRAARPGLADQCRALDEAEVAALAISVDDPSAELAALAEACSAVSVPVLRADLILEEPQIYESRGSGVDAVILHASILPQPLLVRLCDATRATHMAACVACSSAAEIARATEARADVIALPGAAIELFAAVPRRALALALDGEPAALLGKADALLDRALGDHENPAAALRRLLQDEDDASAL